MYKQLSLLALLAVAHGQEAAGGGDLESVIQQIFGNPPGSTKASVPVTQPTLTDNFLGSSTLVPGVASTDQVEVCKTQDDQDGECVKYYLCNTNNNTVITDGAGVIDIRESEKKELQHKSRSKGSRPDWGSSLKKHLEAIAAAYRRLHHQRYHSRAADQCLFVKLYRPYSPQEHLLFLRVRDGPCENYLDACCLVSEKRPPDNPIKPTPKPDEPPRVGCGWANPKGVDMRTTGDFDGETKFGEFPWMVAILKIEPVNENQPDGQKLNVYVGGGSLIHPSVVLTAAHYVAAAKQFRVRAGEWDTQNTKEIYPFQDRDVESIEIHKDFNKGNLFYDIALLFLSKPMDLTPHIGLACLPPSREKTPASTRCFATGWGKDKFGKEGRYQVILKKIEVPVVNRNTCQDQLRKTRLGRHFVLHTSFMCAGGEVGKDTCKGDGGSPLSCPIESEVDRYQQSGIVAWGIGCGENGVPGVYVDVANMRDWIDDKVKGKGYDINVYKY